jgi:hypothetical protein
VAFTGLNAAMGGVRGMTLILTNRSGITCSVYGYPGLAFATSGDVPMTTHLTWVTQPRATVVLRPGRQRAGHADLAGEYGRPHRVQPGHRAHHPAG